LTEASETPRLLYTKDEAADRLRISERTLRRLVEAGRIGYVAVGDRRFFRSEDLDAFLRASYTPAR